jgi:hypothetical protein
MAVITPRPPQTVILVFDDGATLTFSIGNRTPPIQGVVWGNMKNNMHEQPPVYFDVHDTTENAYPDFVTFTAGTTGTLPPSCYWEDGHLICCDS